MPCDAEAAVLSHPLLIAAVRIVVVVPVPIGMMMVVAALDLNIRSVMVVIAGMSVGWLMMMMVAIAIAISADANRHTSRTYVYVLSDGGRGVCNREAEQQSYRRSIFHIKSFLLDDLTTDAARTRSGVRQL